MLITPGNKLSGLGDLKSRAKGALFRSRMQELEEQDIRKKNHFSAQDTPKSKITHFSDSIDESNLLLLSKPSTKFVLSEKSHKIKHNMKKSEAFIDDWKKKVMIPEDSFPSEASHTRRLEGELIEACQNNATLGKRLRQKSTSQEKTRDRDGPRNTDAEAEERGDLQSSSLKRKAEAFSTSLANTKENIEHQAQILLKFLKFLSSYHQKDLKQIISELDDTKSLSLAKLRLKMCNETVVDKILQGSLKNIR